MFIIKHFFRSRYKRLSTMGDYQRDTDREKRPAKRFGNSRPSRGSSNKDFGRFSGGSDRGYSRSSDRGPLEMHAVVCDKCGKDTEVPFKPTSSKPVYCIECFRKNDDSSGKRDYEPRSRPSSSSQPSDDLKKINIKLDKIMKALKIE
jgi:CxxC-x17-CxxC domain-containing protein